MASFFDELESNPQMVGLLQAGLAMMANSRGKSLGEALGMGGMAGLEGMANARQAQVQTQYRDLQGQMLKEQLGAAKTKNKFTQGLLGEILGQAQGGDGNGGGVGGNTLPPQSNSTASFGGLNINPRSLAIGSILGVPGVDTLTGLYKFQNTPQEVRGGSYSGLPGQPLQYNPELPQGMRPNADGTASSIPGVAEHRGAIAGAEAQAKAQADAPFEAVEVPVGNQKITMSRREFERFTSNGELPARFRNLGPQSPSSEGTGPGVTADPTRTALDQDFNKNWLTNTYNPILEAGNAARQTANSLGAFRGIDFQTGWGAQAKLAASSALEGLGMAPAQAKLYAENGQMFQNLAFRNLAAAQIEQKGPQTKADADNLMKTWPQIQNTPRANAFIADFAQAMADQALRKKGFYTDAYAIGRGKGDLSEIDRKWQQIEGSIFDYPYMQQWVTREQAKPKPFGAASRGGATGSW